TLTRHHSVFFLVIPRPPSSPLFPYTTLFRSPSTVARPPVKGVPPTTVAAMASSSMFSPTFCASLAPSRAVSISPASPASRPLKRSEEHTSELQSRRDLVCRLLLEKKKT